MRFTLLLLAAGLSMAAGGGAAAAEIASGSMVRSTGPHGSWTHGSGWARGVKGWRPHGPRPGHGRPGHGHDRPGHGHDGPGRHDGHDRYGSHDRHDRHDRWRGHRGQDGGQAYHGYYGAGGIAGPSQVVDPNGTGFFAGAGGGVRVRGGRPHFDYDRSYPYEWASAAGGRPRMEEEEARPPAPPGRCTIESGVRVCRGW